MEQFLYLASQSPRRSQLLDQLGIAHQLLLPDAAGDVKEDAEALEAAMPGEGARDYVQRVTALKLDAALARLARRRLPAAPVLCADTTVALDGHILGKPLDAPHARRMLARLSGRAHQVYTAVAVGDGAQRRACLSQSQVRLARLDAAQIAAYVATGEALGKAGAYAIQGRAGAYVQSISGSHSGIMGLPLFETAALLRPWGWAL